MNFTYTNFEKMVKFHDLQLSNRIYVYSICVNNVYIRVIQKGGIDMAIQTELFKDKDTQIVVRCKESFKNEVVALAKDNQLKLSSYIKYLLTQELKKVKK